MKENAISYMVYLYKTMAWIRIPYDSSVTMGMDKAAYQSGRYNQVIRI